MVVFFILLGYFSWLPGLRHLLGATALTTFHPAPELLSGQLSLRSLYSLIDIVDDRIRHYGFPQLVRASAATAACMGARVGEMRAGPAGIVRGCSWINATWYCRSALRGREHTDLRGYSNGFRVARTLD